MRKLLLIAALGTVIASCRNTDKEAEINDARQATIDSMNIQMEKQQAELARRKSIDSVRAVEAQRAAATKTVVVHDANGNTTTVEQRKGWSGAAKGAVIGAGVGAISGAVIDKKKPAQGAIIGGLAGAGLGAGTGAVIDSKKKKK
jgi:hypothetical protein